MAFPLTVGSEDVDDALAQGLEGDHLRFAIDQDAVPVAQARAQRGGEELARDVGPSAQVDAPPQRLDRVAVGAEPAGGDVRQVHPSAVGDVD